MLAAVARLAADDAPRPTVVFAAVADEESRMAGARALLKQAPPVDVAVVGEPTSLRPIRVHNGVVRLTLIAEGEAAHTSKAHLGVNAITAASRAVAALDDQLLPRIRERSHPLAGPALLTPATVDGGTAVNVVPDRCEVRYDRRLAPGETPEDAIGEIEAVLSGIRSNGDNVRVDEPTLVLPAVETAADHPLVRAAEASAGRIVGEPVVAEGAPYCTDACVLAGTGGLPFVVLGPGSIDHAHTPDEWVSIPEVCRAVDVYTAIAHTLAGASRYDAEGKGART
jgi:acetylornithine deacetylase